MLYLAIYCYSVANVRKKQIPGTSKGAWQSWRMNSWPKKFLTFEVAYSPKREPCTYTCIIILFSFFSWCTEGHSPKESPLGKNISNDEIGGQFFRRTTTILDIAVLSEFIGIPIENRESSYLRGSLFGSLLFINQTSIRWHCQIKPIAAF